MGAKELKRKPYTVLIGDDLRRRVSEVVYWTPGLTVADFMENAVKRELLRHKPDKGTQLKPVQGKLKRGKPRPLKG